MILASTPPNYHTRIILTSLIIPYLKYSFSFIRLAYCFPLHL